MIKKLVTIALLCLLSVIVVFGTVGSALAEEIRFTINSYQSEDFSEDEINYALSNLQYKLEVEKLPRLLRVEEIYDFNDEPLYGLYEFNNYYMILIRETGSVLERGEGSSAYFGKNKGLKYYGGYEEYYISENDGYRNLITKDYASQSQISKMQSRMKELRTLDYQDYLEALSNPMPLGASNRNRISILGNKISSLVETVYGNKNHLYNYFAQEINIDYQLKYNLNNITQSKHYGVIYRIGNWEEKDYGIVFYRDLGNSLGQSRYNLGYDLLYPKNVYNACSLVAMVILLQYYYRCGLNEELVAPIDFDEYDNTNDTLIKFNPLNSPAEIIMSTLYPYINTLHTVIPSANGAATYVDIDSAFDKYFKNNGIDASSTHFTSYTNIKSAVDNGHPSIMTVGAGSGYDIDNVKEPLVSQHNVVVYGYTTNSLGILDEFICHAAWHCTEEYDKDGNKTDAECAKLYINKFYAAGNLHLNY